MWSADANKYAKLALDQLKAKYAKKPGVTARKAKVAAMRYRAIQRAARQGELLAKMAIIKAQKHADETPEAQEDGLAGVLQDVVDDVLPQDEQVFLEFDDKFDVAKIIIGAMRSMTLV